MGQRFALLLFGGLSVVLIWMVFHTEGIFGGSDSVNHYFLARQALQQPSLFLDAWGRPAYTLLSAPFTLFGFQGSMLFNVLLGLATAWLAFSIARKSASGFPAMVIILVVFTPIFSAMMFTALTEILFAFMLVLGAWLFLEKRYIAAAITYSFLPFARTEGFVLLPLFFIAFLYMRQYRALLFLATGILLFSLAGIPVYHDPFWVFTRFPYPVGQPHEVYTQAGSFFHFFRLTPVIFGLPAAILVSAGILLTGYRFFTSDKETSKQVTLHWLLILLPLIVYFLLHSFLYWQSMGGSAGLWRVMAAVTPLAALTAMPAWGIIERYLLPGLWMKVGGFTALSAWVIYTSLTTYPLPIAPDPEESTIRRAVGWIGKNKYKDRTLFYTDLKVPFFKGYTRYDTSCSCHWFFMPNGLGAIRPGDLFLWDAHFGPHENAVPLDSLMNHPAFRVIGYFRPSRPWLTMGNTPYEVYLFERMLPGEQSDNRILLDSLRSGKLQHYKASVFQIVNFEVNLPNLRMDYVNQVMAFSGKHSFLMNEQVEFSPGIDKKVAYLTDQTHDLRVNASVQVYSEEGFDSLHAALVISLMEGERLINYASVFFDDPPLAAGRWNKVTLTHWLEEIRSDDYTLRIYIWNPARKKFFMDDLTGEILIPEISE